MWTIDNLGTNSIGSVLNDPSASGLLTQPNILTRLSSASSLIQRATSSGTSIRFKDYQIHYNKFIQLSETFSPTSVPSTPISSSPFGSMSQLSGAAVTFAQPLTALSTISAKTGQISEIPNVFFEQDFKLENPDTFNQLLSLDPANNTMLQEKLSHYLDIAEVHLVSEISKRSAHFFDALSDISSLHSRTLECIRTLQTIRTHLSDLQKHQVIRGLSIVRIRLRIARLNQILSAIKSIKHYKSCQSFIQIMLNQADYQGALELIQDTLKGAELNGVKVLQHLKSQLEEMSKLVCQLCSNDFVQLSSDFCSNLPADIKSESDFPKFLFEDAEAFEQIILPLLMALVESNTFSQAILSFKECLLKYVKSIVKQFFPQALPEESLQPAGEQDGVLAKRFRGLSFDSFMTMMLNTFKILHKVLFRIQCYDSVMLTVLRKISSDPKLSQKWPIINSAKETLSEVIYEAFQLAHTRCGKMLTLKTEHLAQLNSKDFHRIYSLTIAFMESSEVYERECRISGIMALKGVLVSISKSWLSAFHQERLKEIVMVIDAESWEPVAAATEFQNIIDSLSSTVRESPVADADSFELNGRQFRTITSSVILAKVIREYLTALQKISIQPDILNRIFELFKAFNTRVCSLIVGGAAAVHGGLKSITAKHLALSSQALLFVIEIITCVKKQASGCLEEKYQVLLSDFDKIIGDYMTNRDQILSRIVGIMKDRVMFHADQIKNVTDWDIGDVTKPNEYINALVTETAKLHRILKRNVFPDTIRALFRDVFKEYNEALGAKWAHTDIFSINGKQKLLADVQFYLQEMSKFEDVLPPSNDVEVLVNNIRIKDRREIVQTQPTAPPPPASKPSLAIPSPMQDPSLSKSNTPTSAFAAGKKFASGISFASFGKFMGRPESSPQPQLKPPGTPLDNNTNDKDLPSVSSQKNL